MNSKKETQGSIEIGQESKWAKGQDRLLLLTPERVELIVNSKKETNGKVKMGQGSKWAKGQNGLRVKMAQGSRVLLFTP